MPVSPEELKRREWYSLAALLGAMAMATGPGVLLVNRPDTVFGLPLVYAWGILWFVVIMIIMVLTDRHIWRHQSTGDSSKASGNHDA